MTVAGPALAQGGGPEAPPRDGGSGPGPETRTEPGVEHADGDSADDSAARDSASEPIPDDGADETGADETGPDDGAEDTRAEQEPYDAPFVPPDHEATARQEARSLADPGAPAGGEDRGRATTRDPWRPGSGPSSTPRPGWGDPDAPPPSSAVVLEAAPDDPERPRNWRMSRATIGRPLTLPQGVLRFDSILAGSVYGRFFFTGTFGLAAGLFDALEIGATPVAVTITPFPSMNDPSVYARVRPYADEALQLAFRAEVTIPTAALEAQMGLAAELAWTANEWFRLDTGVDYTLLFSQPLHQRVGIPVRATFQTESPNAFEITTGVYVFNDFDDVDVPLLAAWIFAWGGYQGPLGETRIEGGVVDLGDAERSWLIRARMTFFAYL